MDDPDDGTYSRPPNLEDVARIGRALNEAQARYGLIGGFAVIIHGSDRPACRSQIIRRGRPEATPSALANFPPGTGTSSPMNSAAILVTSLQSLQRKQIPTPAIATRKPVRIERNVQK